MKRAAAVVMLVMRVMLVLVLVATGCGRTPPTPVAAPRTPVPKIATEKLVAGAVSAVSRLDDFDEQRAYEQAFDRLAQWAQATLPEAAEWRPDPLVETLPERLRQGCEPRLAQRTFDAGGDVTALRDRRWLADIAAAARGDSADDVEVAGKLFDWVVRSLALVGDPPMVPTADTPGTRWFQLGEVLLSGRASAAQRSWVFLELLRQAGIDGVMLATGGSGEPRPWLPAAVIGGEAYLFEPTYGLPIPGTAGRPATARQAAAEPDVLAALSLPDRPYPVKAADAAGVSVLVPADGWGLSRRMQQLDRVVQPRHGVRMADDASAVGRRAAAALPGADPAIALWQFPFETELRRRGDSAVEPHLARELAPLAVVVVAEGPRGQEASRPLFKARVRDFRGAFDGPDGAKAAYLAARPSREVIQQAVQGAPPEQAAAVERLYRQMKEDATYWLGIVTLGEGQPEAAVDFLRRMTLENSPDSRWTDAARANLGRALAALGRIDEAVAVLREDGSPQRFGSRLLADRLERERQERTSPAP
ncbi:MAG: tetratricopeptide repeat protein [Planctomycetota bacterium]